MKASAIYIVRGIRLALVLTLLWQLTQFVAPGKDSPEILGPNTATGLEESDLAISDGKSIAAEVQYSDIVQVNVFGKTSRTGDLAKAPQEAPASNSEMISQQIGIKLVGIVGGNPSMARAVILDLDKSAAIVGKLGDKIKGATIKDISDDVVVVSYQGKDEDLRLTNASPKAPNQPAAPSAKSHSAGDRVQVAQADSNLEETGYVERLLSTAKFSPHLVGDQTEGIKVSGLNEFPEAQRFGFREGDIIRMVNGQILTSKQKAFQVFKKARSQAAIDMELVRNGKVKDLSFKLR